MNNVTFIFPSKELTSKAQIEKGIPDDSLLINDPIEEEKIENE